MTYDFAHHSTKLDMIAIEVQINLCLQLKDQQHEQMLGLFRQNQ